MINNRLPHPYSGIFNVMLLFTGAQGWPSIAYNPVTNEYAIAFQVESSSLLGGNALIFAFRLETATFKLVKKTPQLVLKGSQNLKGKPVPVPVVHPYLIYNTLKCMYIFHFIY